MGVAGKNSRGSLVLVILVHVMFVWGLVWVGTLLHR